MRANSPQLLIIHARSADAGTIDGQVAAHRRTFTMFGGPIAVPSAVPDESDWPAKVSSRSNSRELAEEIRRAAPVLPDVCSRPLLGCSHCREGPEGPLSPATDSRAVPPRQPPPRPNGPVLVRPMWSDPQKCERDRVGLRQRERPEIAGNQRASASGFASRLAGSRAP